MIRLSDIGRFFFQKRDNGFTPDEIERRNRTRYNALYMLDPDVMVRHLSAFAAGDVCGLERVIDEFETRDDKMKVGAFKMASAVSAKPWEVRVAKGEEKNERARLHKEVLTRFWNRITATDAFCLNRRGGVRLLVKQMMSAQSRVYSVHDVTWNVRGDGELEATFTHVPAWCFENRTGRLRYIANDGQYVGEPMRAGEWLVTVGEGVGISASILAMAKRLSWNDWLLFSETCGMPVVMGNTTAQRGTDAWSAMSRAIKAIAPKTGILADIDTKLQAVSMGGSNRSTYHELVETVDRAISALYRGGDLATMSSSVGDGTGTEAQSGESELMDADGCAMVSETLHDQIERLVVRFTCGDFEPLAGIVINPPAETEDVDRNIKIDSHLSGLGVRLSKTDALQRYGRTEAKDESDALETRTSQPDTFGAFANEKTPINPETKKRSGPEQTPTPADDHGVLAAFAKDTGPAAAAIARLRQNPSPEAAAGLLKELPSLIPDDPALAAVIADAMAAEFATSKPQPSQKSQPSQIEPLANENPYHCPKCGKFSGFNGHCDKCGYTMDSKEAESRANKLLAKAMSGKMLKPVDGLIYRREVGQIDLEVGKKGIGDKKEHGTGLSKLRQKHDGDIRNLVRTLAHGAIMPTTVGTKVGNEYDPNRRAIVHGNYVIFLQRKGDRRWKISTHYESENDAAKSEEIKQWIRSNDRTHLQGAAS